MDGEIHFSLGLKRIAQVKYKKHLQWTLSLFSEIFKVLPKATRCKESMLIVILFILNTIFLKLLRKMAWICTHWINGSSYCSSFMWKKRTEDYIMAAKHNLRTHSQESCVQHQIEEVVWTGRQVSISDHKWP